MQSYLMQLFVMNEENMKPWERRMMDEIKQLRMIEEDIQAIRLLIAEQNDKIVVPNFIMDPQMREEAYQILSYDAKFRTVDMRDTILIPLPRKLEPGFDERLREAIDVDQLVADSQQELAEYANKRIPFPARDLDKKDYDLLSKMNLIAQAVKVDEPPVRTVSVHERWGIEEIMRKGLPTEKRIQADEIYKVLYFNNENP